MAKVRIITPEQRPWQISPVRADNPAARAIMPDGGPASAYKIREPGSEVLPQLVELRMHPHEEVALHCHDEDEILYILDGAMKVGARTIGAGASIYIAGGVFYGFTAGPEGVHFLNFRVRDDRSFHLPGKRQTIETGVTS